MSGASQYDVGSGWAHSRRARTIEMGTALELLYPIAISENTFRGLQLIALRSAHLDRQ